MRFRCLSLNYHVEAAMLLREEQARVGDPAAPIIYICNDNSTTDDDDIVGPENDNHPTTSDDVTPENDVHHLLDVATCNVVMKNDENRILEDETHELEDEDGTREHELLLDPPLRTGSLVVEDDDNGITDTIHDVSNDKEEETKTATTSAVEKHQQTNNLSSTSTSIMQNSMMTNGDDVQVVITTEPRSALQMLHDEQQSKGKANDDVLYSDENASTGDHDVLPGVFHAPPDDDLAISFSDDDDESFPYELGFPQSESSPISSKKKKEDKEPNDTIIDNVNGNSKLLTADSPKKEDALLLGSSGSSSSTNMEVESDDKGQQTNDDVPLGSCGSSSTNMEVEPDDKGQTNNEVSSAVVEVPPIQDSLASSPFTVHNLLSSRINDIKDMTTCDHRECHTRPRENPTSSTVLIKEKVTIVLPETSCTNKFRLPQLNWTPHHRMQAVTSFADHRDSYLADGLISGKVESVVPLSRGGSTHSSAQLQQKCELGAIVPYQPRVDPNLLIWRFAIMIAMRIYQNQIKEARLQSNRNRAENHRHQNSFLARTMPVEDVVTPTVLAAAKSKSIKRTPAEQQPMRSSPSKARKLLAKQSPSLSDSSCCRMKREEERRLDCSTEECTNHLPIEESSPPDYSSSERGQSNQPTSSHETEEPCPDQPGPLRAQNTSSTTDTTSKQKHIKDRERALLQRFGLLSQNEYQVPAVRPPRKEQDGRKIRLAPNCDKSQESLTTQKREATTTCCANGPSGSTANPYLKRTTSLTADHPGGKEDLSTAGNRKPYSRNKTPQMVGTRNITAPDQLSREDSNLRETEITTQSTNATRLLPAYPIEEDGASVPGSSPILKSAVDTAHIVNAHRQNDGTERQHSVIYKAFSEVEKPMMIPRDQNSLDPPPVVATLTKLTNQKKSVQKGSLDCTSHLALEEECQRDGFNDQTESKGLKSRFRPSIDLLGITESSKSTGINIEVDATVETSLRSNATTSGDLAGAWTGRSSHQSRKKHASDGCESESKRTAKRLRKEHKKQRKIDRKERKRKKREKRLRVSKNVAPVPFSPHNIKTASVDLTTAKDPPCPSSKPSGDNATYHEPTRPSSTADTPMTRTTELEAMQNPRSERSQRRQDSSKPTSQIGGQAAPTLTLQSEASLGQPSDLPPIRLLCSEEFLETWAAHVVELALGKWASSTPLNESTLHEPNTRRRKVQFFDTSLVDICGVDIEVNGRDGIIVSALSSRKGKREAKMFLRRIVELASQGRYKQIVVISCADIDLDHTLCDDMVQLQNALMVQNGSPPSYVTFTLASPSSLSAAIVHATKGSQMGASGIDTCIEDVRLCERLLFLLAVVPTLTVGQALKCFRSSFPGDRLPDEKHIRNWFQNLLGNNYQLRQQPMDKSSTSLPGFHGSTQIQLSYALRVSLYKGK